VAQVAEPSPLRPTDQEFYIKDQLTGEKKPNPALLKEHFFREGRLMEEHALFILERATDKLSREPNMVDVKSPVTS
jgi:serine/threonine-protein phosphatase 2B catalytic subunit